MPVRELGASVSCRGSSRTVEAESLNGFLELRVSRRAPWQPAFKPLELHENPNAGILERHPEQRVEERLDALLRNCGGRGGVPMIERRSGGQDGCGAGIERTFVDKHRVVRVEDAGCVRRAGRKRLGGIALTANMVAMLAHHHIVIKEAAIFARIDARI